MAEVGKYYVTIMPDMSKFAGAVKSGTSGAGGIASGIGRIFTTGIGVALGNALTSGFGAFMGSLDQGISRIDTINAFPRVMQNIGVDAASSSRAIDMLVKAVDGLPTSLDSAVAATQRFTLANGDAERSAQMFDALNNALLGGGQSAEAQAQALEQISQAYAKGKPDYREWLSMQQNMGPALKMVASAWGMTTEEMSAALKEGDRSMDDFFDTLITLNDEGIDGMASLSEQADVSMANIGTAVANLKNRFAQSWGFIIDEIGQERIATAINSFSRAFRDAFRDQIAPAIGDAADGLAEFLKGAEGSPDKLGPFGTAVYDAASYMSDLKDSFLDGLGPADEFTSAIGERAQEALDNISGSLQDAAPYVDELAESFGRFTEEVGPDAFSGLAGLAEFIASLAPLAAAFGTFILEMGRLIGFLGEKFFGFLGEVTPAVDTFFGETLPGMIDSGLRAAGQWLSDGLAGWGTLISTGIQGIRDYFGNGLRGWGTVIQTGLSGIRTYFENGIAGWRRVFDAFVQGIQKIPGRIVGFFSGIGSRISSAIGSIKFPTPHVSWGKGIFGISLPTVKWYAQGGFVNGAQLIGAGEKGTELIWPSYGSALDKYGAAIAEHMGGAGTTYNVYINDARINDNEAIRSDVLGLLSDLQRYGAMNRG